MVLYLYILAGSWLWGSLPFPPEVKGWKAAAVAAIKGAGALFVARLINDTGLTMTVAAMGLLIGQSWSPFRKFKERSTRWVALGALAVFSPLVAGLASVAALLVFYLSGSAAIAQLGIALFLPFLLWQVKQVDIYVIFGLIMTMILVYQAVPLLNTDNSSARKRLRLRQALIVGLIISLAVLVFFNRYVYRGFGQQVDIIRQGTSEFRVVALTFDDGPDPTYTPAILDILQKHNVPATFFVVGRHVEQHPDIARRIVQEGHSIGNHTWSHRSLVPLSVDQTRIEIMRTHRMIEQVTGIPPPSVQTAQGCVFSLCPGFPSGTGLHHGPMGCYLSGLGRNTRGPNRRSSH
jgi:glycerol-3-phosphate acyltransferase PlsY